MKVIIVVGARPNFMKAAPLLRAVDKANGRNPSPIVPVLVHTGQHYDVAMSDAFFADLNLPRPDVYLGVGSGSHACQTAEIMKRFECVLEDQHPDAVLVVGDVNSTAACALVTAKFCYDSAGHRPLLGHVEAGLRSFDRSMPEECNRVVTDHLSDLLFITEKSGLHNLQNEGIAANRIFFVGNTMIDCLLECRERAKTSIILDRLGLSERCNSGRSSTRPYAVLTLHRPNNVDDRDAFLQILKGMQDIAAEAAVVFPMHPRTFRKVEEHGLSSFFSVLAATEPAHPPRPGIVAAAPLGYLDFLCLLMHARLVVTDSGGIQEETTCLGVPCVTVRNNTERPVTVEKGTNRIAGTTSEGIRDAIRVQWAGTPEFSIPHKWDGHAAERIIQVLLNHTVAHSAPIP